MLRRVPKTQNKVLQPGFFEDLIQYKKAEGFGRFYRQLSSALNINRV